MKKIRLKEISSFALGKGPPAWINWKEFEMEELPGEPEERTLENKVKEYSINNMGNFPDGIIQIVQKDYKERVLKVLDNIDKRADIGISKEIPEEPKYKIICEECGDLKVHGTKEQLEKFKEFKGGLCVKCGRIVKYDVETLDFECMVNKKKVLEIINESEGRGSSYEQIHEAVEEM